MSKKTITYDLQITTGLHIIRGDQENVVSRTCQSGHTVRRRPNIVSQRPIRIRLLWLRCLLCGHWTSDRTQESMGANARTAPGSSLWTPSRTKSGGPERRSSAFRCHFRVPDRGSVNPRLKATDESLTCRDGRLQPWQPHGVEDEVSASGTGGGSRSSLPGKLSQNDWSFLVIRRRRVGCWRCSNNTPSAAGPSESIRGLKLDPGDINAEFFERRNG
jgi:hypothetical protein